MPGTLSISTTVSLTCHMHIIFLFASFGWLFGKGVVPRWFINATPRCVHKIGARYFYKDELDLDHDQASTQMLLARSLTSCNFRFISAAVSKLPSWCDANPHCGETLIRCNASATVSPAAHATIRAASNTRSLSCSLSSNSGNLLVTSPNTSDVCFGKNFSGSNVPAT